MDSEQVGIIWKGNFDMKKMFSLFMFFLALGILNPVFSNCSKDEKEIVTGAACSIAELNSRANDGRDMEKSNAMIVGGRDLRPVRIHDETPNINKTSCFWGQCLSREIFDK